VYPIHMFLVRCYLDVNKGCISVCIQAYYRCGIKLTSVVLNWLVSLLIKYMFKTVKQSVRDTTTVTCDTSKTDTVRSS
jgi:hypothetical protein